METARSRWSGVKIMPSAWDALRELLWSELKKIEARRSAYVGKIEQATASDSNTPGEPTLGRVLVSGIEKDRSVLVHPTLSLDGQIRNLGASAIGQDILVLSVGGQYYGLNIQLTGEK